MNIFLIAVVLALSTPARVAEAEAKPAPDVAAVIGFERDLWNAWKTHDAATLERLTAADYYSISEEGPDKAIGLAEIRTMFAKAHLRDYRLGEMAARTVSPDVIALFYNAHMFGDIEGKDFSRGVAEGSVWARRDGKWVNVILHEITRTTRDASVDP